MPFRDNDRTVPEFIKFLESETELKLSDMFAERYPEYRKQHNIPTLVDNALRALVHAKPSNVSRFLVMYFMDPDNFAKSSLQAAAWQQAVAEWLEWGVWIEEGLKKALPEKPALFLAEYFEPKFLTYQVCLANAFCSFLFYE